MPVVILVYMDKLLYSPFEFPDYQDKFRKQHHIQITTNLSRAHVIMSSYLSVLKKYALKYGNKKKYLLWTHEPYHDYTLARSVKVSPSTKIEIMNVYSGDVFTHNFRYFYFRKKLEELPRISELEKQLAKQLVIKSSAKQEIVALSTYYDPTYYKNNSYTLLPKRYQLIETGFKLGLVDVYGKNWEQHEYVRPCGNSRNDRDRRQSKQEIMCKYRINVCLENVDYPYYVTEKIWESIKYGCLPIYQGNPTIDEVFPEDSFIDTRQFSQVEELYQYLTTQLTEEVYRERMNRCIRAFNQVIEEGKNWTHRGKSNNLNLNYLEYETCYQQLVERMKKMI